MNPKFKILLTFLLFTCSLNTVGQQLPIGTFTASDGGYLKQLTIKDSNRFEFYFRDYIGGQQGCGKYLINGKSLVLTFDSSSAISKAPLPVVSYQQSDGDTSILSLAVYQIQNKQPIIGAVVRYRAPQAKFYSGIQTNSSGKAELRLPKALFPLTLHVGHTGLDDVIINLTGSGTYEIDVPMDFTLIKTSTLGDTKEFTIISAGDSYLGLISRSDYWYLRRQ